MQPIHGAFNSMQQLRSLRLDATNVIPFVELLLSEALQLRRLELLIRSVNDLEERRLHSLLLQSPQLQVVIKKAKELGSAWKLEHHLENITQNDRLVQLL